MAQSSAIEWTQATLNPWTGCTKVDPACAHCYIENTPPFRIAGRKFERGHIPLVFHMDRLAAMMRRRKPTLYFVNSLSDLFHEDASDEQIAQVFAAMASAPQHTFQVLTKRHERMRELLRRTEFIEAVEAAADDYRPARLSELMPWPLPNVWMGVTIGNRRFVNRARVLADTPAAVRFLSCEPLLGPLFYDDAYVSRDDGSWEPCWRDEYRGPELDLTGVDWCIIGGESGPRHRRFDLEWARDLRDACHHEGVAVFVKQLGGARPGTALEDLPEDLRIREFPAVAR